MIVWAVTLLPLPDSPTIPSVSPLPISKLTFLTASNSPERVENDTLKSLTVKIGSIIPPPLSIYVISDQVRPAVHHRAN
ncbi:hypothetical protein D3C75_1315280 [compost metagenome]